MSWFELLSNLLVESEATLLLTSFLTAVIIMFNYWSLTLLIRGLLPQRHESQSVVADKEAEDELRYSATDSDNSMGANDGHESLARTSPININSERCVLRNLGNQLTWRGYGRLPFTVILHNNGETVVLRAAFANGSPRLSGAHMRKQYNFVEINFKWGEQQMDGSEHMINFKKYPLELQALHSSGPFMRDCLIDYDLLAVAYFFDVGADNCHLQPVVSNLHRIRQPNTFIEIPSFRLESLLFPFGSDFFSYQGTFADLPSSIYCRWFVYPNVFSIGANQLQQFRQLRRLDGTPIVKNSRVLQPLGNREVVFNAGEDEQANVS